ncbi:hypothetical protein METBIDRAFT_41470 [Metschnikowia bicuspidata var. bicuspidata NRRL YB-4993]|uniref:Uncharacterized protein n=1 Tax=Metschnikowia bicuspidata var. bicuspidata NRRL YB-4993 TaxID=869754 RepID=A0A1A0HBG2_9ASCO|nr:hypothetical protein METBIDRAFT_41470 [Metschnikowia bicuspidata var. bicuspidata NRRL YB-4993]OBA21325.1 hypothetical protein METBIDRAFT_41470 [Metschnikowia bicuspidata var. bicuspidata NRRL YB-4993]
MPSTKSATPSVPPGHAAETLRIGTADEIATLAKLTPVVLPNDALVASLKESHPDDPRWRLFRNHPDYIYVINWLFQCRGYIRLASEHFDTDLFEIELFELVNPPPVDDMALLINKIKLALISKVHGKKVLSLAMFETLFRVYFGGSTPLSGPSEEEAGGSPQVADPSVYPCFEDLFIDEKLAVLAILITEVSLYPDFRDFIDKAKIPPENLRLFSGAKLAARDSRRAEEYLLLFDDTALYKRTISAPELSIPKKRKLAPQYPESHYPQEAFDITAIQYELVYKDVYGLDALIKDLLKNKKTKNNKAVLDVIRDDLLISNIFSYEIKKRKILSGRRKEFEMARLLATRKRSSRIEAKEKQKHLEEQERKAHDLEDLKHATSRRSQRARDLQELKLRMDFTAGLSRGERLNLRKEKGDETVVVPDATPISSRENTPLSVESSVSSIQTVASPGSSIALMEPAPPSSQTAASFNRSMESTENEEEMPEPHTVARSINDTTSDLETPSAQHTPGPEENANTSRNNTEVANEVLAVDENI